MAHTEHTSCLVLTRSCTTLPAARSKTLTLELSTNGKSPRMRAPNHVRARALAPSWRACQGKSQAASRRIVKYCSLHHPGSFCPILHRRFCRRTVLVSGQLVFQGCLNIYIHRETPMHSYHSFKRISHLHILQSTTLNTTFKTLVLLPIRNIKQST